jgi:hypothetical protein
VNLVEFPQQTVVIAKDQSQYRPMPAHRNPETGVVTCCWSLSWKERFKLLLTGKLWHQIMTFGLPLQPQLLLIDSPFPKPEAQVSDTGAFT